MNPKSASALVWFAVFSIYIGIVCLNPGLTFVLYVMAALSAAVPTMFSRTRSRIGGGVALIVSVVLAVMSYPDAARHQGLYMANSRQSEARQILAGIYKAEMTFYHEHKRYGTLGEIGFTLPDHSNRYTYRIDHSGKPGTVFPAKDGILTPENTIVQAGISPDGQRFTATATGNIDNDPTLDQWHVNNIKQNLQRPDVNDITD